MFTTKRFKSLMIFFVCLFLVSCGGGGEGGGVSAALSISNSSSNSNSGTTDSVCSPEYKDGAWHIQNASCECINAVIQSAEAGDTINVPADTGSVIWSSYVYINKPIKIIGPGQNPNGTHKLKIKWSGYYAFEIANGVNDWRVSGFEFDTTSGQLAINITNSTGWRVDNNKFINTHSTDTGVFVRTQVTTSDAYMAGVIDNNEVIYGKVLFNNGRVNSSLGGYIWYKALTLGSNNTNTVYVEDNTFTFANDKTGNCTDASRGGDYVFRYNNVNNTGIMAHSIQTSAVRGTRKWEVYGNRFNSTSTYAYAGIFFRGGTGVIFGNDFTSDVAYNYSIVFDNVRDNSTYLANDNRTQEGSCDGNHDWDGNEDSSGWPCRDQIGTSSDAFLWTSGTPPVPKQAKAPAYLWANYDNRTLTITHIKEVSASHILADRDYYEQQAAFNGTSGVGCGSSAPTMNCMVNSSTGVGPGYYVLGAGESCSDFSGYIGASHTKSFSGTLYRCTATNTWTSYYRPYTYPHPLRN